MADGVLIPVDGLAKAYGHGRAGAQRQRSVRMAIRQLERAELYLVPLYSLDIDDRCAEESVDELIRGIRGLRQYLNTSGSRPHPNRLAQPVERGHRAW